MAAGEIGVEHAHLIDRYHKQIPAHYDEADRAQAEQTLVELARSARPEALCTAGREMVRLWQADGAPPPEPRKQGMLRALGDRRPKWTIAHHIPAWSDGGQTDIDQMALLCQRDHHIAHHTDWTLHIASDGLPEWIPPPSRDPDQKPIRNQIHHAASNQTRPLDVDS